MSTIREIARELNLSHTTVSRVLNARNAQAISSATQERIWTAARRMDYRPHTAARALATGRTQMVALLMHYLYTAFHAEVVHTVEQTLRQSGYQVVIVTVDWYGKSPDDNGLDQLPGSVDGYLAFETSSYVSGLLADQQAQGSRAKIKPMVAMGGHNIAPLTDFAGFDLTAGTDMALQHLQETGRQRIAYVAHTRNDPRYRRYAEVMREAGLPEQVISVPSQRRGDVRDALREYLSQTPPKERPEALFCFNDEVAIGVHRALRDFDVRIGKEIALVGIDGIEDGAYMTPSLTTVALPIQTMCELSWEMLQRRLANPEAPPSRTMLPPTLIVRESTTDTTMTTRP